MLVERCDLAILKTIIIINITKLADVTMIYTLLISRGCLSKQVVGFGDRSRGKVILGVNVGHPIVGSGEFAV